MEDLKSLTLSGRSFAGLAREQVAYSFAFNAVQYLSYDYLQPIATQITQDAKPRIVDTPLTLISRMVQGVCLCIF